ncbi:hypothetical protein EV426DRAFT_626679 [Tirmania nivea]|nr:hypothetical protein EV426DRAFT_626679 [Tirmania nivea]
MPTLQAPQNILQLYADLRSQLATPKLALLSSRDLVRRLPDDTALAFSFQAFLFALTALNESLKQPIFDFLRLFPSNITSNTNLLDACAELVALGESPEEDAVWSAVTHILSPSSSPTTPRSSQHLTPPPAPQPLTPRKPPPELPDDTPVHVSSGLLFSESARTHADVDPYLRTELRSTVFKDVQGFHAFFPGVTEREWVCAVRCPISCTCDWLEPLDLAPYADEVMRFPPQPYPSERSVIDWFNNFNQRPVGRRFYGSGSKALDHSSCTRQCDIFLAPISRNNQERHSWYDVLVPGELKASAGKDCTSDTIVQLAGYVREVFGSQVNRRFIHAFTICGSMFRCYLFDRSGGSISDRFDIRKNGKTENLFVRILLGYVAMSPQQLGFDTNYTTKGGTAFIPSRSVPLPTYLTFRGGLFQLIEKLFHRPVIVSRGTLCWLAQDECGRLCVIKDTWRAGWRISEGELLSLAEILGVWGLPQPLLYGDVTNSSAGNTLLDQISQLRSPLSYTTAKRVIFTEKHGDRIYLLSSGVAPTVSSSSHSATSKKRPSVGPSSSGIRKLAKVDSTSTSAMQDTNQTRNPIQAQSEGEPVGKAKTQNEVAAEANSRSENSAVDIIPTFIPSTLLSVGRASLLDKPFIDRTHSIIVSNAVGKRIEEFSSIRELLEAFRDAIRCHRSLVEDGGILHRDVSPNNIMIQKHSLALQCSDSPKGFLIDLDLAKQFNTIAKDDTPPSEPRRRTGTMMFMAIEVLEGSARQTWRHDLESFLYVLIWLCVTAAVDSDYNARRALAEAWSVKDAANNKLAQMSQDRKFKEILSWFAPSMLNSGMTYLVEKIRDVLFPVLDEGRGVDTGTLKNRTNVYDEIIQLIDEAVNCLEVQ